MIKESFDPYMENTPFGNSSSKNADDAEMDLLNNQIQMLLKKMENIIARTSNKNKGYAILHQIGKSVQDSMGITDTNMRKAVLGQMPNQNQ